MELNECMQMTLEGDILLSVTVNPGAKQTALIGYDIWTKSLKISVKARAEGGKANYALVHAMAEILQIPNKDLQIISGLKSKKKQIKIVNTNKQLIKNELNRIMRR